MSFDPTQLLDIERRTGVKEDDIDDFLRKANEVEAAIKGMMDGSVDPNSIKIEGLESEEEKAKIEAERQKRLEESRRKAEELRLQRKLEERERWWAGAELFTAHRRGGGIVDVEDENSEAKNIDPQTLILQRYTADYSRWNEWVPRDPASLQEQQESHALEEAKRNEEFEKNNAEFCKQFVGDMKERSKAIQKKKDEAESLRNKGNRHFKRKEYVPQALAAYMESLKLEPYETKTLTNIAQVFIKINELDDAQDFLGRAVSIDPDHVKAHSRLAFVMGEKCQFRDALQHAQKALKNDPTNADLIEQQRELEIMAREADQESELRNMMAPPPPIFETEYCTAGAATAASAVQTAAMKSQVAKEQTRVQASLQPDLAIAQTISDHLSVAIAEWTPRSTTDSPQGDVEAVGSRLCHLIKPYKPLIRSEVKGKKTNLFDAHVKRMSGNSMIKVHARTSGLLKTCVDYCVCVALELDANAEQDSVKKGHYAKLLASCLHLVTAAVTGERSSMLILAERPTILQALRSLLKLISYPDVIYAVANLFFVGCIDDACKKTHSLVRNDRTLALMASAAVGELIARSKTQLSLLSIIQSENPDMDTEERIVGVCKAVTACAMVVKEMSFTELGKAALAHVEAGSAVCALCSMLYYYSSSLIWDAQHALEAALDALLGLSQIEVLRGFFAIECPVGPQSAAASPVASTVEVILKHIMKKKAHAFTSNCLAILMNACLDNDGSVRKAVFLNGGMDEALKGLKLGLDKKDEEESGSLICRQAGLMSRLATVEGVQSVLYDPENYRLICRGLSHPISIQEQSPYDAECIAHLVRTLAALHQPPTECRKVALEEKLVESLLHLFPRPREDLGEITPASVVQVPKNPASPVLIGNAARCLMPYADDVAHAAVLYRQRDKVGIEKLINAMATCTDIRVRKNLAILLAKGCRYDGVRELVTHFRGMQMLTELQDKLV